MYNYVGVDEARAFSPGKLLTMHDENLFRQIREALFTAVIGDVMDQTGLTRQFLPPEIRALKPESVLVGRAMPVLEADCVSDVVSHNGSPDTFGLMFRALDSLKPREIYICTGASPRYALWGGLMSTKAVALGASGAVLDGYHRDTREILTLNLPVFSAGAYAQDQRLRGRVVDFRCTIEFGNGCRVAPGDVIVGDIDGVLVMPAEHVEDIVHAALTKVAAEDRVRLLIVSGQNTEEIFETTGIM